MVRKINVCRICGNDELVPVVDLGEQYLTGVFPRPDEITNITKGPLKLVKCHSGDTCKEYSMQLKYFSCLLITCSSLVWLAVM